MDAGILHPIRCGNTECSAPNQFCCIPTGNAAPRCVSNLSSINCGIAADEVHCDDRTDCQVAGQVCCAQPGIGGNGATAMCRPSGTCNGMGQTELLCDPEANEPCPNGGSNACRTDNQTLIAGYPSCH